MSLRPNILFSAFFLCALALVSTGCRRQEVEVYSVPKEAPKPSGDWAATAKQNSPHEGVGSAEEDPLAGYKPKDQMKWTLPAGWKEVPANPPNVASFSIREGEKAGRVSVTPLPVKFLKGHESEIENIWRQEAGADPLGPNETGGKGTDISIAGEKSKLFDISGNADAGDGEKKRVVAAGLTRGGDSWYFKLSGPGSLVEKQKAAFVEFLSKASFAPAPAEPKEPGSTESSWKVPSHWKQTAAPQFAMAGFLVPGKGGNAMVSVSQVGGALLENVNRWRGQLGLAPLDSAELDKQISKVDVKGETGFVVDMSGTRAGAPSRTLVVLVPSGQGNWIYKMTGDPETVGAEKTALVQMAQSGG